MGLEVLQATQRAPLGHCKLNSLGKPGQSQGEAPRPLAPLLSLTLTPQATRVVWELPKRQLRRPLWNNT